MKYMGNVWSDSNTEHVWRFVARDESIHEVVYSERTQRWSPVMIRNR